MKFMHFYTGISHRFSFAKVEMSANALGPAYGLIAQHSLSLQIAPVQPAVQWQLPLVAEQVAPFWHEHAFLQPTPYVPGGHGVAQSEPLKPAEHLRKRSMTNIHRRNSQLLENMF